MACGGASINYSTDDPVADARAAFAKGDFHLLVIQVGDSGVTPVDSAYEHTSINVAARDPLRYVPLVSDPDAPGVPGRGQLAYVKRFNTEVFRLLEENAHSTRRAR